MVNDQIEVFSSRDVSGVELDRSSAQLIFAASRLLRHVDAVNREIVVEVHEIARRLEEIAKCYPDHKLDLM